MNKLVCSALAAAALGSSAHANGDSDDEWLGLDEEISHLASNLAVQEPGVSIGVLLRSSLNFSDDARFQPDPGSDEDLVGFSLDDVDAWLEGSVGEEFEWRVNVDVEDPAPNGIPVGSGDSGDSIELEDAYTTWHLADNFSLTMGQFKTPFLRSSNIFPEYLLFTQRSFLSDMFDFWDEGLLFNATWEEFAFALAAQNGVDSLGDDLTLSGRAEVGLNGGTGMMEGALGAPEGFAATLGAGFWDDNDISDATAFGLDAFLTFGQFSVSGQVVDLDDDVDQAFAAAGNVANGPQNPNGIGVVGATGGPIVYGTSGGTPWDVTGSFVWNDNWEFALRWQDFDDTADHQALSGGVNYFLHGHNAKVQASITDVDSDAGGDGDGTIFAVGLAVGSSTTST